MASSRFYGLARKQEIANYAKEHGVNAAARHYNLAATTIQNYCKVAGFHISQLSRSYGDQLKPRNAFIILKRLLDGDSGSVIASDLGVSRQRVSQVKESAIAAGFRFD